MSLVQLASSDNKTSTRKRKLENNRLSAKKSRQKKKEKLSLLEEQVKVLEIQNAELEITNQDLANRIEALQAVQEPVVADFFIDDVIFDVF